MVKFSAVEIETPGVSHATVRPCALLAITISTTIIATMRGEYG